MPRKAASAETATKTKPAPKPSSKSRAKPAPTQEERAQAFAIEAARTLDDDKCTDIVILDVRSKSPVTDFIVIGTGTSDRQMRSVLHHVIDEGVETGHVAFRSSSDDRATWLLADFADVIVHIFEPNTRAHYDLEMMWGDAPRVTWTKRTARKTKRTTEEQAAEPADA